MKTFTLLTVSKRIGWERKAVESVKRQTVQPKEWIVVCEELVNIEATVLAAPIAINPSNLNASLNLGLAQITTDYVIFYQDFIDLPEDCFEKLLNLAEPMRFVTTCTPNYDGSNDTRYLGVDKPRVCLPEEWETNVAIAPMQRLRDIGGFDERLDAGWSWDNVNIAQRAAILGVRFIIDESNRPTLLEHEQTSKLVMELNGALNDRLIQDIREGRSPLNIGYL